MNLPVDKFDESQLYTVAVEGDTNDGDYASVLHTMNGKDVMWFIGILNVIKTVTNGKRNYNWPANDNAPDDIWTKYEDHLSEEDIGNFNDYMPTSGDYDQIHTLESVRIAPEVKWERLL